MVAAIPGIYYLLAIYSSAHYFRVARRENPPNTDFFPPISCLKPIRGLDDDAYENYASFCRQDYPDYEILFCVDGDDPALPVLEKLIADFPERKIRLLYGSGRDAINDKVGRLVRLVSEAQNELLVITDGDIRVGPDYLRAVAHPFRDPKVGGATTLYVSTEETTLVQELQSVGMISDFFAGILVAWQLDGIKFMFGQSIVTKREYIAGFGGYEAIENRPADDLNVGRLVAAQGYEVKLLPYRVKTVADFQGLKDLFYKRVRWMTVMRLMRAKGHFGLIFTWGLVWALIAVAIVLTWLIGIHGMRQPGMWPKMLLVPLWDAMAFLIWILSFGRKTIRWRGFEYYLRDGILVPVDPAKSHGPR
jgi:ceramide glucosyltransferase